MSTEAPRKLGDWTPPAKTDVFARKSSGLVRAASTLDASLVNLYVATFPIMVSFILGIVLPFYAGANLYLTLLIGALLALPILVTYAVATSVMRRSGGDYVFISRMLHPAVGFGANFVFVLFQILFLTSSGYYFCQWCLAPLARVIGAYSGDAGILAFATQLTTPLAIFIVSEIFVVGFGLLFIFRNTRSILKVFRITLPMISPVILFNLILGVIGSFSVFSIAYIATEGGPNYGTWFYMLHLYYNAFSYFQMGYASALAWIFFLLIFILSFIQIRLSKRWVYYEFT